MQQTCRPERPMVYQLRASQAPPWVQSPSRNRSEGAGVTNRAPTERSVGSNRDPGRHSLRSFALGWWTPTLWAEVTLRRLAFRIPTGFDVSSRGCNPRNRRCAASALKGPNHWPASPFDPCRVGDCGGGPFSGFHPELVTLRPSGAGAHLDRLERARNRRFAGASHFKSWNWADAPNQERNQAIQSQR